MSTELMTEYQLFLFAEDISVWIDNIYCLKRICNFTKCLVIIFNTTLYTLTLYYYVHIYFSIYIENHIVFNVWIYDWKIQYKQ